MREYERKFLLKNLPDIIFDKESDVTQLYVPRDKDIIRFRKEVFQDGHEEYKAIIKENISFATNDEIPLDELSNKKAFESVLDSGFKCIKKKRHYYKLDEVEWHIDKFKNIILVLAEAEMPFAEYPLETIVIDPVLIMEVTRFKEFSNKKLSIYGS